MSAGPVRRLALCCALLALAGCRGNRLGYAEVPVEATPNARLREGDRAAVLARYFTLEEAVTSRVWGSQAGAWAFSALRFAFDDELKNVTPSGPELLFLPADFGPVRSLPAPPGVLPGDLVHVQREAGATPEDDAQDVFVNQRTARFVMAAPPELLIIRHRPEGRDRLLRLLPGASTWAEEQLPASLRDVHLREAGPEVALFELPDGTPVMVRGGQPTTLDAPPAVLAVPPDAPRWLGPFDGTTLRVYWTTPQHELCTGTWNLVSSAGRRDGCVDLVVEGARVLRAAGTVEESIATVLDWEPLGRRRVLTTVATASGLVIKGEGGYGDEDAGAFVAWPGTHPVLSESECPLEPSHYAVSRHFDADGGFGLVRCPQPLLADTCACDRSADLKTCDCLQRSVATTRQFRVGRFEHLQAGWERLDGRLLLRVHRAVTDTSLSSSIDPVDALKPYTGPFSWVRDTSVFGLAPGYGTPSSELTNLGRCTFRHEPGRAGRAQRRRLLRHRPPRAAHAGARLPAARPGPAARPAHHRRGADSGRRLLRLAPRGCSPRARHARRPPRDVPHLHQPRGARAVGVGP